jgi:3-deoxy-D-manno-octulosonic-acid transferase
MHSFLYDIVLHGYALLSLPRLLSRPKGRPLGSWLGIGFPALPSGQPRIWVHAPSVGESRAAIPLVQRLRAEFPQGAILFTVVTATGRAEAERLRPHGVQVAYLPFDLPYLIGPVMKRVRPDLLILTETDLWYHFLRLAKKIGARIALVNGKISRRSSKRWEWLPSFARLLLGQIDRFCLQDELYRTRFVRLGAPADRIQVTGNLKFDALPTELTQAQKRELRERLKARESDRIVVVGSTHDPEERMIVDALRPLLLEDSSVKLLIVPRHPQRFDTVGQLLASKSYPSGRLSLPITGEERLILIDAMGLLNACYAVAELAIVGGSFVSRIGGHNLLEPLAQGAALIYGPFMHAQAQMAALVQEFGAGCQASLEEIAERVRYYLADEEARKELIRGGEALLSQVRGTLEKTWRALPLKDIGLNDRLANHLTRGGAEVSSLGS